METLDDALKEGVQIELRCQRPSRIGTAKVGRCQCTMRLHVETLVATRGHAFPIRLLQSRLLCPRCGHRNVMVVFYGGKTNSAIMAGE